MQQQMGVLGLSLPSRGGVGSVGVSSSSAAVGATGAGGVGLVAAATTGNVGAAPKGSVFGGQQVSSWRGGKGDGAACPEAVSVSMHTGGQHRWYAGVQLCGPAV